jgi:hypothetical protein
MVGIAESLRVNAEHRGQGGAGLLSVGVGRYGVGDFNFSLGVNFG